MTQDQIRDGLVVIAKFIVRGFAVIGLIAVIAILTSTSKAEQKVARSDRCINSACEPGQKCSVRFQRHMGTCDGAR